MSAEALAASWPLPDGTRLGPRMFSNLSDAPYVGETALLFSLTRQPIVGEGAASDGYIPASVYFGILFYLVCGGLLLWRVIFLLKRWRALANVPVPQPKVQLSVWIALFTVGLVTLIFFNPAVGIIFLLLTQTLPSRGKLWSWLIDYDALTYEARNQR